MLKVSACLGVSPVRNSCFIEPGSSSRISLLKLTGKGCTVGDLSDGDTPMPWANSNPCTGEERWTTGSTAKTSVPCSEERSIGFWSDKATCSLHRTDLPCSPRQHPRRGTPAFWIVVGYQTQISRPRWAPSGSVQNPWSSEHVIPDLSLWMQAPSSADWRWCWGPLIHQYARSGVSSTENLGSTSLQRRKHKVWILK